MAIVTLTLLAMLAANVVMLGEVWGQVPPEGTGSSRAPAPTFFSKDASPADGETHSRWTIGSGFGLLGRTPDHTAFAWNTQADYFLHPQMSFGPLLQLAFTDDLTQVGLSGQAKYWLPSQPNSRTSVNVQSGVGFVYAGAGGSDVSWLVPMGVGMDYALSPKATLSSALLINFTNLNLGRGAEAHVMPGFSVGIRF